MSPMPIASAHSRDVCAARPRAGAVAGVGERLGESEGGIRSPAGRERRHRGQRRPPAARARDRCRCARGPASSASTIAEYAGAVGQSLATASADRTSRSSSSDERGSPFASGSVMPVTRAAPSTRAARAISGRSYAGNERCCGSIEHADLLPRLSRSRREPRASSPLTRARPSTVCDVQSALLSERAAPAAQQSLRERAIARPQHRLHLEASQWRAEADRRVELESAIEHLVGASSSGRGRRAG